MCHGTSEQGELRLVARVDAPGVPGPAAHVHAQEVQAVRLAMLAVRRVQLGQGAMQGGKQGRTEEVEGHHQKAE